MTKLKLIFLSELPKLKEQINTRAELASKDLKPSNLSISKTLYLPSLGMAFLIIAITDHKMCDLLSDFSS